MTEPLDTFFLSFSFFLLLFYFGAASCQLGDALLSWFLLQDMRKDCALAVVHGVLYLGA